ncbi:hypothetical protein [Kitasatospora sp. NPDC054795]
MKKQRVLVAYGSKHGATAGIAQEIGRTLDQDGFDAVVVPAAEVQDVSDFDAVFSRQLALRGPLAPRRPALRA